MNGNLWQSWQSLVKYIEKCPIIPLIGLKADRPQENSKGVNMITHETVLAIFLFLLVYATILWVAYHIGNSKILLLLILVMAAFAVVVLTIGVVLSIRDTFRGTLPIQRLPINELLKQMLKGILLIVPLVAGMTVITSYFEGKYHHRKKQTGGRKKG